MEGHPGWCKLLYRKVQKFAIPGFPGFYSDNEKKKIARSAVAPTI